MHSTVQESNRQAQPRHFLQIQQIFPLVLIIHCLLILLRLLRLSLMLYFSKVMELFKDTSLDGQVVDTSQDNANCACMFSPSTKPWQQDQRPIRIVSSMLQISSHTHLGLVPRSKVNYLSPMIYVPSWIV